MTDTVDRATRSRIMAAVHTRDTSVEMLVRRAVHKAGFRYRIHRRDLPGTPDMVFAGPRLAVFVHGCFWHSHGCKRSRPPSSNRTYWLRKMEENRERDRRNVQQLHATGWRAVVIWECEVDAGIARLLDELASQGDRRACGAKLGDRVTTRSRLSTEEA